MKRSITSIPKKTMDALKCWDWPGNVRELENVIERAVILTQGSVLAVPLGEIMAMQEEKSKGQTLAGRSPTRPHRSSIAGKPRASRRDDWGRGTTGDEANDVAIEDEALGNRSRVRKTWVVVHPERFGAHLRNLL
jgi:DNA-binding NtrC family response regulator